MIKREKKGRKEGGREREEKSAMSRIWRSRRKKGRMKGWKEGRGREEKYSIELRLETFFLRRTTGKREKREERKVGGRYYR